MQTEQWQPTLTTMVSSDLVQVIAGAWKGCLGSVLHRPQAGSMAPSATQWMVQLYRDTTVCVAEREMVKVSVEQAESGELPVEYVDAQVRAVDNLLGAKTAAWTTLATQVQFLTHKREECLNGGVFTHADRVRLGQVA